MLKYLRKRGTGREKLNSKIWISVPRVSLPGARMKNPAESYPVPKFSERELNKVATVLNANYVVGVIYPGF